MLLVGLSPVSKEAHRFWQGLRDAGCAVQKNVVIEWRTVNGDYDRVPALVADSIQRRVEVTMRSTSTIPIVMALLVDPVGSGLVNSLAHPGGHVTGLSMMTTELNAKRLRLLREPRLARVSVRWNPVHRFIPEWSRI